MFLVLSHYFTTRKEHLPTKSVSTPCQGRVKSVVMNTEMVRR